MVGAATHMQGLRRVKRVVTARESESGSTEVEGPVSTTVANRCQLATFVLVAQVLKIEEIATGVNRVDQPSVGPERRDWHPEESSLT